LKNLKTRTRLMRQGKTSMADVLLRFSQTIRGRVGREREGEIKPRATSIEVSVRVTMKC